MMQLQTTSERSGAAVVAIAPLVLLVGFVLHPWIGAGLPDQSAVAAAATEHTTRWGIAHLTIAVASGLLALAFLALRARLREAGEYHWSRRGLPFIVFGSVLYALLPAMEMAPLFAAKAGVDVESVAEELVPWFVPFHVLGGVLFVVGIVFFRKAISNSGILSGRLSQVVIVALTVMAVARFVPLSVVSFYVQSAAGIVALWPLAFAMWTAADRRAVMEP